MSETEKFCRKRNSGHLGHPRKVLRRKKRFQWGMSLQHQTKESCPTPCQKRNYLIKAQVELKFIILSKKPSKNPIF